MARKPTANPAELESQLGPRDATFRATTENRTVLKSWLRAKGIPSAVADKMKLDTMCKCYRNDAYLSAIIRNHAQEAAQEEFADGEDTPFPPPAMPATPSTPDHKEAPAVNATPNVDPASAITSAIMGAVQSALANTPKSIDEAQIIALIEKHARPVYRVVLEEKGKEPRPLPDDEARHEVFPDVLTSVSAGVNVMLVGPAGSGKTTIAEQVAKALEIPFEFTGALDSAYKLSGFIDAQGRIVHTAFRRAYEHGGLFLFDEVDGSLPGALLAFNAALANGHADFPDGVVKRHENFRVIAAANTYGHGADRQYVGRNQLDAASLDRFAVFDMDYDEGLEKALAGNAQWVAFVQKVRRAVRSAKVRHVVSPRASLMGARLLSAGMDRNKVEEATVWKGMDEATRQKVRAAF